MTDANQNLRRLVFVRSDLAALPECPSAGGYELRHYQPGDEVHWLNIHRDAERNIPVSREVYAKQFGLDSQALQQRQLFLFDDQGVAVGTVTAWFDEGYLARLTNQVQDIYARLNFGRIHWLAVRSEFQGHGLGRLLTIAACRRLRELGHERAYLVTWPDRPRAIRIYQQLGFSEMPSTEKRLNPE